MATLRYRVANFIVFFRSCTFTLFVRQCEHIKIIIHLSLTLIMKKNHPFIYSFYLLELFYVKNKKKKYLRNCLSDATQKLRFVLLIRLAINNYLNDN